MKQIIDWIHSDFPLTKEMFDDFKVLTRGLNPADQLLFFKKILNEIAKGSISLNVEDLLEIKTYSLETIQDFGEPVALDYTLDLILHTLKLINFKNKFPNDVQEVYTLVKEIADFICEYLQNNLEYLGRINLLFDNCPGRTSIVRKRPEEQYINLRGNNYKVYRIYQGYSIVNRDSSGWGDLIVHFHDGIYAKGHACMLEIRNIRTDRNGYDNITYGKNIDFNEQLYPFEWKKDENNYLITPDTSPVVSCEGRKSPALCNLSGEEFWWCYGKKCFKANQPDHPIDEWKKYSLRDILNILKLPFNDVGYYIFVSEINRLNRLLDRIKCSDCQTVLRPSKQTHFGFYRVSHFQCKNDKYNNENCPSYDKQVYLTHCLNSKCTNVIDDRVAKRCPNGFIICDVCGSCCSNDQFARRIQNLKTNGQPVSHILREKFDLKMGHWEKAECYCYKCQKEMTENKGGEFNCKECDISYDRFNVYIRFHKDYSSKREAKGKEYSGRANI